jgi:Yip1 domain
MSQDPNSIYGSNPQNPYGAPQDPYSTLPQNPYGDQPQNPDNTPQQNPYGPPPQNPYRVPPQNPYGPPPPQNPYSAPPQGAPYGPQGYGPGPNVFTPLPLSEAVRQLPNQYIKVLTKPSAATFAEELPKAGWDITWIQLLIYVVITVVLGLIRTLIKSSMLGANLANSPLANSSYASILTIATGTGGALLAIITVPLFFFINTGLQYLLARAFGGRGSFLGQAYTNLLFVVSAGIIPSGIIAGILGLILSLIPVIGQQLNGLVVFALGAYTIILNVFQIQASHRLTGGKATGVVLLTILIYVLLFVLCAVAFAAFFIAIYRSTMPHY